MRTSIIVLLMAIFMVVAAKKQKSKLPPETGIKLTRFIIFGTLFATVPFLLDAFVNYANKGHVALFDLFRGGDLFLVSAGIGFSASGELVVGSKSETKLREAKLGVSGLTLFAALVEACLYVLSHGRTDPAMGNLATSLSVKLFWGTFYLSIVCIGLSEA